MCFFGSKVFHLHIMHNSDYRISEYYVLFWVQMMPTRVKLLDFLLPPFIYIYIYIIRPKKETTIQSSFMLAEKNFSQIVLD